MKSLILRQWEAAAYAAGTLTQLRRVVKPQPVEFVQTTTVHAPKHPAPYMDSYCSEPKTVSNPRGMSNLWCWWTTDNRPDCNFIKCPYGAPGDALALREACRITFPEDEDGGPLITPPVWYMADGQCPADIDGAYGDVKPSSKMPLWAVRWHPVVQSVRLERVQDVTTADIGRMGIDNGCSNPKMGARHIAMQDMEYMRVWNRDNPRTPWDSNPWCWVLDVEGVKS